MSTYTILKESFLRLNTKQLKNLKWHVENKTPVICGRYYNYFTTKEGGA